MEHMFLKWKNIWNKTWNYLLTKDWYWKKDTNYLINTKLSEEGMELFWILNPNQNQKLYWLMSMLRFVVVEVNLHWTKTMLLGMYVPNKDKVMLYKWLMERLVDFSYENWWWVLKEGHLLTTRKNFREKY